MQHITVVRAELLQNILRFLAIERVEAEVSRPTLDLLERLVTAYTRSVPWESAFRIAKRAATAQTADCPRWPEEFWRDAMERGGGGTCFESNYAFFALLQALGYDGYLTINNMGESCGCHTAIVLFIGGERWLVDVGIPLYTPVPLSAEQATEQDSPFHTYTITPQGDGTFEISRDRHPSPYIFTLVDRPVTDAEYRSALTRDYAPGGHFLTEVIISKVIGDHVWRFNGRETPPELASFGPTATSTALSTDSTVLAPFLAHHFTMDETVIEQALQSTAAPDP
jgi:arylamine N-acetyltransferase